MFAELLGWIGNVCFLLGILLIARKNKHGFTSNFFGNSLYLVQSIVMHNTSLGALSVLLAVMNLYGAYNWTKDDVKKEKH